MASRLWFSGNSATFQIRELLYQCYLLIKLRICVVIPRLAWHHLYYSCTEVFDITVLLRTSHQLVDVRQILLQEWANESMTRTKIFVFKRFPCFATLLVKGKTNIRAIKRHFIITKTIEIRRRAGDKIRTSQYSARKQGISFGPDIEPWTVLIHHISVSVLPRYYNNEKHESSRAHVCLQ